MTVSDDMQEKDIGTQKNRQELFFLQALLLEIIDEQTVPIARRNILVSIQDTDAQVIGSREQYKDALYVIVENMILYEKYIKRLEIQIQKKKAGFVQLVFASCGKVKIYGDLASILARGETLQESAPDLQRQDLTAQYLSPQNPFAPKLPRQDPPVQSPPAQDLPTQEPNDTPKGKLDAAVASLCRLQADVSTQCEALVDTKITISMACVEPPKKRCRGFARFWAWVREKG